MKVNTLDNDNKHIIVGISAIDKQMKEKGVIDDLINDYEDLHGMSSVYLNDHISSLLAGK